MVFGVEKLVLSKLYEYGANKRIMHIDNHIGMVRCCNINFQKKMFNCFLVTNQMYIVARK